MAGDFDFQIRKPVIAKSHETFHGNLRFCLNNITERVVVARCEIVTEADNTVVAMVKLQLASGQTSTFETAIQDTCRAMMDEQNQCWVNCMSERHVWGIIPVSRAFKAYWNAFFFERMLSLRPSDMRRIAREVTRESRPYFIPTFAVFGFAALAGAIDSFRMMSSLVGTTIADNFDFAGFLAGALPTVAMVFRWFTRPDRGRNLDELREDYRNHMQIFGNGLSNVVRRFGDSDESLRRLLRDNEWMISVCSELCDLSIVASEIIALQPHFLGSLERAVTQERSLAIARGAFTLGVFGAGALIIPGATDADVVAGRAGGADGNAVGIGAAAAILRLVTRLGTSASIPPVAVTTWAATQTIDASRNRRELREEYENAEKAFTVVRVSWQSAFTIRLRLELFRLRQGQGLPALRLDDVAARREWNRFVHEYRQLPEDSEEMISQFSVFLEGEANSMARGLQELAETGLWVEGE
ncbi:hypothetical protein MFIFM68171_08298 [Madurella fahalii]|uniref:Uncharacterized protein n=1 Tax=Madurella fahalii TaxID=1157608 RepID=A0ABQ0GJZ9_9PEZI